MEQWPTLAFDFELAEWYSYVMFGVTSVAFRPVARRTSRVRARGYYAFYFYYPRLLAGTVALHQR